MYKKISSVTSHALVGLPRYLCPTLSNLLGPLPIEREYFMDGHYVLRFSEASNFERTLLKAVHAQ